MKVDFENIEDCQLLMLRYLDGEATEEEKTSLLEWLKKDKKNLSEFNSLRIANAQSKLMGKSYSFDSDNAFSDFKNNIQHKKSSFFRPWMQVAAALFITIACISIITNFSSKKGSKTLASSSNKIYQTELEDGTVVKLQPNSEIISKDGFGESNRKISIKGEVFFNVKHNPDKPFIIKVNKVTITDIGTSFFVKADSITKRVSIGVKKGVVSMKYAGKTDTLRAGDYAITNVKSKQIETKRAKNKSKIIKKNNYSKTSLNFKDTPLTQVISELKERYNVNFCIKSKELNKSKLNATFESNMSLSDVKVILGAALNANVKEQNGTITLEKISN